PRLLHLDGPPRRRLAERDVPAAVGRRPVVGPGPGRGGRFAQHPYRNPEGVRAPDEGVTNRSRRRYPMKYGVMAAAVLTAGLALALSAPGTAADEKDNWVQLFN